MAKLDCLNFWDSSPNRGKTCADLKLPREDYCSRCREFCGTCGAEIRPIVDPWGCDEYRGIKYGYYHVIATENNDGKYVIDCPQWDENVQDAREGR